MDNQFFAIADPAKYVCRTTTAEQPRGGRPDVEDVLDGQNTKKIQRANLDGSGSVEDLVTTVELPEIDLPEGIAVDGIRGKVYWTDLGTDKIYSADLDGSNVQAIVTGLLSPRDIAVDVAGGKIYWAETASPIIQRADLDGSNVQAIVTTGVGNPRGIAVDSINGKIYWTDVNADDILQADLGGTNVQAIVTTGLADPVGIAVDTVGGRIYWANQITNSIQRADLDGANVGNHVGGLSQPFGVAVDVESGKIYWSNTFPFDKIEQANLLDGANVQDLVTGLSQAQHIATDVPLPISISWAGAGFKWDVPTNWNPNIVPRAIDDVTINLLTTSPTLNVNGTVRGVEIIKRPT